MFAVNSFRLPKVPSLIISCVSLNDELHAEVEKYLLDKSFHRSNNDTYYAEKGADVDPLVEEDKLLLPLRGSTELQTFPQESAQHRLLLMARQFPDLFQWAQFHAIVLGYQPDTEDEKISGGLWLQEFQKGDSMLFFMYIHEWVEHACSVSREGRSQIDWKTIRGYRVFVPSFVFAFKRATVYSRDLLDSSCSMLLTEPSLINFYLHHLLDRTNVYDLAATQSRSLDGGSKGCH